MSRSRSQPPCRPVTPWSIRAWNPWRPRKSSAISAAKSSGPARGLVVFRVTTIDDRCCSLRTTEDVFLFAWGTDQLSHRAEDLDRIRRWTAHERRLENLLRLHHAIRPKPKGRPTYRLVTQMEGKHGYLRRDARKAWPRAGRESAGKLAARRGERRRRSLADDRRRHGGVRPALVRSDHAPSHVQAGASAGIAAANHGGGDDASRGNWPAPRRPRSDVRGRHDPGGDIWRLPHGIDPQSGSRRRWAARCRAFGLCGRRVDLRVWVGPRPGPGTQRQLPLASSAVDRASCPIRRSASSSGEPQEIGPLYNRDWSANSIACCGGGSGRCC